MWWRRTASPSPAAPAGRIHLPQSGSLAIHAKFPVSPEAPPLGELASECETERVSQLKQKPLLIFANQKWSGVHYKVSSSCGSCARSSMTFGHTASSRARAGGRRCRARILCQGPLQLRHRAGCRPPSRRQQGRCRFVQALFAHLHFAYAIDVCKAEQLSKIALQAPCGYLLDQVVPAGGGKHALPPAPARKLGQRLGSVCRGGQASTPAL